MAVPCALFASCADSFKPDEFIKLILNTDSLPQAEEVTESIKSYDWHIDTKYYTANVSLCTSRRRTIGDQTFAEAVQAFIVYFDPKKESSFELMKAWMPYLDQIEPEILILVCDSCSQDDAVSRLLAQTWCIDNSFELVELNPEQDTDNDDLEDDFAETTGIKRIVQALHAHTWPNLVMKEKPCIGSSYYRELLKEESELKASEAKSKVSAEWKDTVVSENHSDTKHSQNSTEELTGSDATNPDAGVPGGAAGGGANKEGKKAAASDDKKKKTEKMPPKDEMIDSLIPDDDMALLAALGNEDPGEESFEQLFEKLRVMKDKAEALPPEQRKVYAEKVAISFWKAIGGDEDEIDGLGEDSDGELQPS